jgi:phosphotransferase family enzyme
VTRQQPPLADGAPWGSRLPQRHLTVEDKGATLTHRTSYTLLVRSAHRVRHSFSARTRQGKLMPLEIRLTGQHPVLGGGDIRRIINEVAQTMASHSPTTDGEIVHVRLLPGGFSGAMVAILSLPGVSPLIVKSGPLYEMENEIGTRSRHAGDDPELAARGLAGLVGSLDVEIDNRIVRWGIICYRYVGGLSFRELENFSDIAYFLRSFVSESDRDKAPSETSVRACLRETAELLTKGEGLSPEKEGRTLSSYLRPVEWGNNIRASLTMAASLWPDISELADFEHWFTDASNAIAVAPISDSRLLHGDARLANILIDSVHTRIHLIDFGNGRIGHLFEDLARFELDMILTTARRHPESIDLVQDELLKTFALALREGFGLWDVQTTIRPERCLKLWREELAGVLSGAALPGMSMMYRWFLLVECLTRLRWVGTNGPQAAGVDAPSLLRVICALRKRLSGDEDPAALPISTPSDGMRVLHCVATFVPTRGSERSVNEKRNAIKRASLEAAARRSATVRLMAETGQSYLSSRGVFSSQIRELLLAGGSFQAVICNPAFLEAYGISASFEPDMRRVRNWPESYALNEDLRNKFGESVRGFQMLRDNFGPLVDVRVARFGLGATILMTDEDYFYEPYFRTVRKRRQELLFDSFEMQFRSGSLHARTLLQETFEFHWEQSEALMDQTSMETRWSQVRSAVFQVWRS